VLPFVQFVTSNTWVVGLAAVGLVSLLSLTLRLRADEETDKEATQATKRKTAWAQAFICIVLGCAAEYAAAHTSHRPFSVNQVINWITANIGTSLVVYRSGKRAWAWLKWIFNLGPAPSNGGVT
jgi:hypothetical protein